MMKHSPLIITCLSAIALTACMKEHSVESAIKSNVFVPAKKVHDNYKPLKIVNLPASNRPLKGQIKPVIHKKIPVPKKKDNLGNKVEAALKNADARQILAKKNIIAARHKASFEPSKDGFINAVQVYPYTKGAIYKLYSAKNKVSDISLQPGENLVDVSAGDTARWILSNTTSGSGPNTQIHIHVKPIRADIETNLVITTNKRSYFLDLISSEESYMSSISWKYPHDTMRALKRKNKAYKHIHDFTADKSVRLKEINFRYRIVGEAPWKPKRVFDDGHKVYIQFPSSIAQKKAPPLFIRSASGKTALVNYRVKGRYYIVDRLFTAAELRLGKEDQEVVQIVRKSKSTFFGEVSYDE